MTAPSPQQLPNPLVLTWVVQLIGTMVIAVVVYFYVQKAGAPWTGLDAEWARYALIGGLLSIIPALLYLTTYRRVLDPYLADQKSEKPNPALRTAVASKLAIGGALAELPMAFGSAHLLMGGEMRWFLSGVLVSLALRTSFRPFIRKAR
ncbi:hypothetical protein [Usitatibacter palustris]|uniref:Uncharacterized protein n=1 Tax=Usitatibacter palustris TaxID=2732487 RepID=A0A6M4H6I4_9PROT|nr:hypothetical protein [Usitatibacter palustris]QJR14962.1 hypothetical protein DSM104440_01777 [Usitatibacter palustris]